MSAERTSTPTRWNHHILPLHVELTINARRGINFDTKPVKRKDKLKLGRMEAQNFEQTFQIYSNEEERKSNFVFKYDFIKQL